MRGYTLIASVSALAIAGSASGQEVAQATGQATLQLEEIVVTAQRREQRLQDVPLTVSALSDEALAKAGVANIFDLQTAVSGLAWGGAGNATQPSIRGLSTSVSTGGAENPNALYVDGVYYAQPQLFGANLPDVDRVEVLKGPQGTLFGRNSVGGAIRIFTKNPTYEQTGDVTLEAGLYTGDGPSRSTPHYVARGFVNIPLVDQKLAMTLSGGYDWTDGWMTNDETGERYGTVERKNARTKLRFDPSETVRVLLSGYYLEHDDRGLQGMTPLNGLVAASQYPGTIVPTIPYHTAFDTGAGLVFDKADVKSHGFSGQLEWELAELGVLTATSAYNKDQVRNLTTIAQSKGTTQCLLAFACVNLNYPLDNKAFSQELNFSSEQFGMFRFTGGLFYYHQKSALNTVSNEIVIPGGVPSSFVRYDTKSYAAYGEVEAAPSDEWTITVGGRYTREPRHDISLAPAAAEKKQTFESFLPRVSVRYAVSPETNIYATYAVGEKSGLTGISNTGSVPRFKEVDPEKNNAYEVGVKYAAGGFSFNAAAFYYDYKNKQEQSYTGTAVILQNTGPVRIYGLDADASVRLNDEFTLKGNLSWVPKAEYKDFPDAVAYGLTRNPVGTFRQVIFDATGMRPIRSPKFTGNINLDFERALNQGTLDASANLAYSSAIDQDMLGILRQEAYATLSARAGYTFQDSGLRIGVYGRNLTGKTYINHAFPSGVGFTVNYARPQEGGLTLSYRY